MAVQVSVQSEPLVDPRGVRKVPTPLAPRLPNLDGRRILLFNNTQLTGQLPTYGPVLEWLGGYLQATHGAACSFATRNLFDVSPAEMVPLAEEIFQSGAEGVVIALCKAGMTQPTSLFAATLEHRGLPCVQLCTEHAIALAGTTAASYAPGLPIVLVHPATGEKEVFGKAETEAIAPEIVAGLITDPAVLLTAFSARFPTDKKQIADGISLPTFNVAGTEAKAGIAITLDPGAFAMELYEKLCAEELSDGLPVIPPTATRVEAMLACTDRDPQEALVSDCPPSGSAITVRGVAVNAVMAGCRPEYLPILIAAFQAMADPAYRLFQAVITTHPAGNAVVVSGPLAPELGIHSGAGCLGPGFRANATIGRAVNLTLMNVTRAIPNKSDMSIFGSPAEFTFCFAESDADNPWQPLHADLYGADVTSVTVHKCEAPHNVLESRPPSPETLLRMIAAAATTPGANNMTHLGQLIILLNPGQADMIARAGWSKRDVQEFLFEVARHPVDATDRRLRPVFPPYFHQLSHVPVMRSPEEAIVVVCGGTGPHAMVSLPWGLSRAVSRPVTLQDGSPLRTLKGQFPMRG